MQVEMVRLIGRHGDQAEVVHVGCPKLTVSAALVGCATRCPMQSRVKHHGDDNARMWRWLEDVMDATWTHSVG
jgi:hypothetical protein